MWGHAGSDVFGYFWNVSSDYMHVFFAWLYVYNRLEKRVTVIVT